MATLPTPVVHRPAAFERISNDKLAGLAFWEDLSTAEKTELQSAVLDLSTELSSQVKSILRSGRVLDKLYEIANPHGGFRRVIELIWNEMLPISTAYRWMNIYRAVRDVVTDPVIDVAVASGIQLVGGNDKRPFGKYTNIVKALPPPQDGGVRAAKEWVEEFRKRKERLKSRGPQAVELETDREELTKETYLHIRARAARLQGKAKSKYLQDTAAYSLGMTGSGSAQLVQPSSPPTEWKEIRRGRPRKDKEKKVEVA